MRGMSDAVKVTDFGRCVGHGKWTARRRISDTVEVTDFGRCGGLARLC
jgi:hypothetical protein